MVSEGMGQVLGLAFLLVPLFVQADTIVSTLAEVRDRFETDRVRQSSFFGSWRSRKMQESTWMSQNHVYLRKQAIEALWQSPLGRAYSEYMLKDLSPNEVTQRAYDITHRIFSEGRPVTRLSAIQILSEDLYERNLLDRDRIHKLVLLEGNIWDVQTEENSYTGSYLAYQAVAAFLLFVPSGSPFIRRAIKEHFAEGWIKIKNLISRARYGAAPTVEMRASQTRRMIQSRDYEALKNLIKQDYSFSEVLKNFSLYFTPYSMAYFLWFDWKESKKGTSINRSIRGIHSLKDYNRFVEELAVL